MVEHFLDTIETIGEGYGFPLFGARHLITLAVFLAFTAGSCILYGRADKAGRGKMRKLFAILLLADELFSSISVSLPAAISTGHICRCTSARSIFS